MEYLIIAISGTVVGALVTFLFTKLFYQNLLLTKQIENLAHNQKEVAQYIIDYPTPDEIVKNIALALEEKQKASGFDMSMFANMNPPSDDSKKGDKLEAKAPDYTG